MRLYIFSYRPKIYLIRIHVFLVEVTEIFVTPGVMWDLTYVSLKGDQYPLNQFPYSPDLI